MRNNNTDIRLHLKSRRATHETMGEALMNLINLLNFQYVVYKVTEIDIKQDKITVKYIYNNGNMDGEMSIVNMH